MRGALRHRTAPQESRLPPVPATPPLTPGLPLRGRSPMTNPFQTVSENREPRTGNKCIVLSYGKSWSGTGCAPTRRCNHSTWTEPGGFIPAASVCQWVPRNLPTSQRA